MNCATLCVDSSRVRSVAGVRVLLLLRQSVTIVYCCYGSLWQSCIVFVVTAFSDNRVLLRQSVTVVYCCCSISLWQSCIVVTAVCDSRLLLFRSLWQSCIVTEVCDSRVLLFQQSVTIVYCCYGSLLSRVLLFQQSVTIVYCCYGSLWQLCVVVVPTVCDSRVLFQVCDNRVLLLRQSVAVVYCCCSSSLWQSCIVVMAVCDSRLLLFQQSVTTVYCCYGSLWHSCVVTVVCDNRVLLLLRQSVTTVYCCYSNLSERHSILYNCKRVLSLTENICVRLQFCSWTDGQATDALQYTFCVSVTVHSLLNAVVSGSGVKHLYWWHCLGLQLWATAEGTSLNLRLKLSSLNSGLYWLSHSIILAVHRCWLLWNVIQYI